MRNGLQAAVCNPIAKELHSPSSQGIQIHSLRGDLLRACGLHMLGCNWTDACRGRKEYLWSEYGILVKYWKMRHPRMRRKRVESREHPPSRGQVCKSRRLLVWWRLHTEASTDMCGLIRTLWFLNTFAIYLAQLRLHSRSPCLSSSQHGSLRAQEALLRNGHVRVRQRAGSQLSIPTRAQWVLYLHQRRVLVVAAPLPIRAL